MDNRVSNFALLARKNINESTDAAILTWSGRLFHSGIERDRNDIL